MRPERPRCSGPSDIRRRLARVAVLAMACGVPGTASAAPPDVSPERFVRAVYARYGIHGPGVPMTRPGGSSVYAPALLDAFAGAAASTPAGDIGPVDYDPLCACQDFSGLKLGAVRVAPGGAGRATARVTFAGTRTSVTLSLVRTPAGWRIGDVGGPDGTSVAAELRAALSPKRR